MTAGLEVAGLRVDGDAGVLLDISELAVEAGTLAVITGPTDSGKTLLAAVLSGLARPSAGECRVGGRKLEGAPSARRRLGLAATVGNGGRVAGCTVAEALRLAGAGRARVALDRFPVLARRAQVPAELLSGGEQLLLQVACAWSAAPVALVLDAPTTGLAVDAADLVRAVARDAAADGAAVLWLDQAARDAPCPARWSLRGNVLSAVPGGESTPAPA